MSFPYYNRKQKQEKSFKKPLIKVESPKATLACFILLYRYELERNSHNRFRLLETKLNMTKVLVSSNIPRMDMLNREIKLGMSRTVIYKHQLMGQLKEARKEYRDQLKKKFEAEKKKLKEKITGEDIAPAKRPKTEKC